MKFASKIFIYIFLSVFLIIGGLSISTHAWILNHHIKRSVSHAKEMAMIVALKSDGYILRNERVELLKFFQLTVRIDPHIDYIFAEKQKGIFVHTFDKGVPKGLLSLGSLKEPSQVDITPIENDKVDVIYHLRIGIGDPAHSILHLGVSDKKIRAEIIPYRNIVISIGCILLATVPFSLAYFISRLVSKPMYALRNGVKRIGSGELDYRLNLPTGDEIEQLVDDINLMAEKLEKSHGHLEAEITERMQAESRLAKQTELLDNILSNIPHHVFWKDKQSIYLGCNKAFAEAAGLKDLQEVSGKTDYDLPWKKEEADVYRKIDQKVLDTGFPMFDIEAHLTQANGEEKTVITSKVPLKDHNGFVFGVLGIFYDITERKRMEETLKQTQKMEAIGTLAGGIAHDFNNILGGIIGYTELAKEGIDTDDPAYVRLKQVLKSAERAKNLVRQILAFSRKHQLERRPIQLSTIVKEESKLLRSTLPTTIEIRKNINDVEGMVDADPTQLHQVIMNLCTNAAHSMPSGEGLIEISLSSITVTPQDTMKIYHDISPGYFMELKISDTGTGIDTKIMHRIFEPFFTTKGEEKGTGMGLAVVHGIVKDYGGDILVESNLENGTTFTVLLPKVVSESSDEEVVSSAAPKGNERVLLVDDEEFLLGMEATMLGSLGYQVTAFNSSIEALNVYRSSPDAFDLVITDQTMPNMTGYNLAIEILTINPSARIILCTGFSEAITPEKVEAAGIQSLLYKPFSKKQIAELIREVLNDKVQTYDEQVQ